MKSKPESDEPQIPLQDDSDICQQLLSRYSASKATHHQHLLATAAAIRSILSGDSLPLSPSAYFAAAVDNLSNFDSLDSTAVAALLSFVSIVVPLIPDKGIDGGKASEALGVLAAVLGRQDLGAAGVTCVVKCLGVLISRFCDLEYWGSVEEGFQIVLQLSVDKRPKVRKVAQDCLENVFKSLQSSSVIKKSSKLVLSMLTKYEQNALELSEIKVVDGSKDETLSKPEHVEVLHMLNLLKLLIPYLSVKSSSNVLSEILKYIRPHFSALTRHLLRDVEAFLEKSSDKVIGPHIEDILNSLCLYISSREKNPADTFILAASLLKVALCRLHKQGSGSWMMYVPKVCGSVAGLLTCENTSSQASNIMKEMINYCIDGKKILTSESLRFEDASPESSEAGMIKALCAVFERSLSSSKRLSNKHLLEVISNLFTKLGEVSFMFMKNIVLKLAKSMNNSSLAKSDTNDLHNCFGSSVVAMGPERILTLVPIAVDVENLTCSNMWLIPVLKKHVIRSSLGYYIEHIVPLAKSFAETSQKVKKSVTGQDLQAHAHELLGLLPAFCHYPVDTHKKFNYLAKLLISFLKEDPLMHQNVAIAIQALVIQNRSALSSEDDSVNLQSDTVNDALPELKTVPSYSKKTATRNINAIASCSTELLQVLVDIFVDSQSEELFYMKDAIGSLASITDTSITKKIFLSLLERFKLVNDSGEFEQLGHGDELSHTEQGRLNGNENDQKRHVILELASSLVEGAAEDLVNLIYNYIVHVFKETDITAHSEAYHALSRILKEHSWFCSSHFEELVDLLLNLKPPVDVASLTIRFACFHILIVHTLQTSLEEENTKGFLMLNEIILTSKDAKDEIRKVAYDTILVISSSFRKSSCSGSSAPYHQLVTMIMGYLSGPSPQIKSAAVSVLSLLVYNDADICTKMPDIVPSILSLLQSKAVEVIKAVLGFVKVLVSTLPSKDLQTLLPDIINGILLWSTVSRFHFKSKVTVILEILVRKCGTNAVESNTPAKYQGFVKTVLQNRHHKSTSQDTNKTDLESKPADSSNKRMNKRKHKELESASMEIGSFHSQKRGRKHEGNRKEGGVSTEGTKTARDTKHFKSKRGRSESKSDQFTRKFNPKNKGGDMKFRKRPASVSEACQGKLRRNKGSGKQTS